MARQGHGRDLANANGATSEGETTDVEEVDVDVDTECETDVEDACSEAGSPAKKNLPARHRQQHGAKAVSGLENEQSETTSEDTKEQSGQMTKLDVGSETQNPESGDVEDQVENSDSMEANAPAKKNPSSKKKGPAQYSLTPAQRQEIKKLVEDESVPAEKRLKNLREKYAEALMLQNGYETYVKVMEKRLESVENDLTKNVQLKNRLEALCRDLQAHNKKILADSKLATQKQEQLRMQSNAEFQSALDSLSQKIESSGEMERINTQLRKALDDASARLKLIEEHHAKQLEAKGIELQLQSARAAQQHQVMESKLQEYKLRSQLQESLLEENQSLKDSLSSSKSMFDKLYSTVGDTDKALKGMRQEMKGLVQNKAKVMEENRQLRERYATLQETHKTETKRLTAQAATQNAQLDKLKALTRSFKQQLDARDQNQALEVNQ